MMHLSIYQRDPSHYSHRMSKAALSCLALLFCLGQSGCGQKQTVETPAEQPTHDAAGYLIQPEEDFLVGGESPGWKHLFIQIEVNGNETRPFILNIEDNTSQPHDDWPLAPEIKPDRQSGSGDLLPPLEGPSGPLGSVSLNTDEVAMVSEAVRKYYAWSDTAAKENLNVEEKQMLSLTNQHFTITFSRPKESSNSFMNLYVPNFLLAQSSLPPPPFSITLDKMGVDRLLSVITNLPGRRGKFIAFRDAQNKIARQRREAEQNEKARTDELLH
jgi:hypothetical protein